MQRHRVTAPAQLLLLLTGEERVVLDARLPQTLARSVAGHVEAIQIVRILFLHTGDQNHSSYNELLQYDIQGGG